MTKFIISLVVIVFAAIIPITIGCDELPAHAEEFLKAYEPLASKIKQLINDCGGIMSCIEDGMKNDAELSALEYKNLALEATLTEEGIEELNWRMYRLRNKNEVHAPTEEVLAEYEPLAPKIQQLLDDCKGMEDCINNGFENDAELSPLNTKILTLMGTLNSDQMDELVWGIMHKLQNVKKCNGLENNEQELPALQNNSIAQKETLTQVELDRRTRTPRKAKELPAPAEEFLESYEPLTSAINQLIVDCWYLSKKDDEDEQRREIKDCTENRVKNDAELSAVETKYLALKETLTDEQLEELERRMTRLLNEAGI